MKSFPNHLHIFLCTQSKWIPKYRIKVCEALQWTKSVFVYVSTPSLIPLCVVRFQITKITKTVDFTCSVLVLVDTKIPNIRWLKVLAKVAKTWNFSRKKIILKVTKCYPNFRKKCLECHKKYEPTIRDVYMGGLCHFAV